MSAVGVGRPSNEVGYKSELVSTNESTPDVPIFDIAFLTLD
ncbi:hypothetical protein R75465_08375 [Paraburkholderia aspalathi]|nr:hypothetical protein R75465_08375 [Paraburkholderia aspalathi]